MLHSRSFRYVVFFIVSVLTFMPVAGAQTWSGVLSSSRAVDWQDNAGISGYSNTGALPSDNWTQCGTTIAAYGSTGSPASTATITSALKHTSTNYSSCGSNTYVKLGPGDFYLTGYIGLVGMNNDELRGSGPTQTRLHFPNGGGGCPSGHGNGMICIESGDGTYAAASTTGPNWTAGYAKGATSITLSSGSNITANSTMLMLDQDDDGYTGVTPSGKSVDNGAFFNCGDAYVPGSPASGCSFNAPNSGAARPHRFQTEMVQVTSCSPSCGSGSSTTVTIKPALIHPNWASGQSPAAWLIQPAQFVGIRDLTLDGSQSTYSSTVFGAEFNNVANFWSHNVTYQSFPNITIFIDQSMHGDISSNYIYNSGQSSATSDNSGINWAGSDNLIANNICQNCHLAIIQNGPGAGNVLFGNFLVNGYTGNATMFADIWDGHSNGADFNLYEENYANSVLEDQAHGTHLMNTFYRNFLTGWESCANGNCGSNTQKTDLLSAASPLSFNRYDNWVGNVMGTPGINTIAYAYTNAMYYTSGSGNGYIWNLGSGNTASPSDGYAGGPVPIDPVVSTSIYRWGNWDAFHGSTQWNTAEVPSAISVYPNSVPSSTCTSGSSCPASFYFSGRPSWWSSSIPYPAIGPDVSGGNVGQCSGKQNTRGQYAGVPATASSQCTGGTLDSAWAGHVNAIPAMACYLSSMKGPPDGTGTALAFDANSCYGGSSPVASAPGDPTGLSGVAK